MIVNITENNHRGQIHIFLLNNFIRNKQIFGKVLGDVYGHGTKIEYFEL